jgi:hypothetical protein
VTPANVNSGIEGGWRAFVRAIRVDNFPLGECGDARGKLSTV